MNILATVGSAWEAFATRIGAFLPDLFAAIVILFVGWVCCSLIRRLALHMLWICQVDRLGASSGVSRMLELGGVRQGPSEVLAALLFWFLFLIVIVAALDTLGLPGVTDVMAMIFHYIPRIAAAIVVLILGLYFANFLETVTRTSLANVGLTKAVAIGQVTYYATTIFIGAAILQILQIAEEIVMWAFILIFGSVCLALALAFGIGGRDVAGRLLAKWLEGQERSRPNLP